MKASSGSVGDVRALQRLVKAGKTFCKVCLLPVMAHEEVWHAFLTKRLKALASSAHRLVMANKGLTICITQRLIRLLDLRQALFAFCNGKSLVEV